ncbi:MAG: isopentenyl phosphate kinase [Candidatus Diapherotrites archaeon]|nr:isopentenyl phosphate kinase [Candidatus Diapherotrites archaeon]
MHPIYILKLGGSSITEKHSNEFIVNQKVLAETARAISHSMKKKNFCLIVVHGAGPFGHRLVKQYKIEDRVLTEEQVRGFVRTHKSVADLNNIVLNSFIEHNIDAFSIQPSACIIQKNKKIEKFDLEIIKELLSKKIVPILYGDMVVDVSLGASVISGDTIVTYLAKKLKATKVFFGTNVDGIYNKDPNRYKDAKLIRNITYHNIDDVLNYVSGSLAIDVTKGMKGKLSEIANNLKGIECYIFKLSEENLKALLEDKTIDCTKIFL